MKNVYQVSRHDGIERLGVEHHPAGHCVDEHLVHLDVGEILCNLRCDLVPHDHAVALGVALCDDGELLPRALLGRLKGKPEDTLDGVAGEYRDLGRRLPLLATVRSATLPSVLALAVLANNDPVEVAVRSPTER